MHYDIPANTTTPITVADKTGTCGMLGIVVTALDGNNGPVWVGTDYVNMQKPDTLGGQPNSGFPITKLSGPGNTPMSYILAPFTGKLYAVNYGGSLCRIDVTDIELENG